MRRPQLDGLRIILFLFVFAIHYSPHPMEMSYFSYALPVFFVMSGFLITNVLLDAEDASLGAKLKNFYVRRILRICPSYFLVVGILIAMGALAYPIYYLTYLVNHLAFELSLAPLSDKESWGLLMDWRRQSLHLWSLSVEEQFYIIFPLLLFLTPVKYRVPMLFAVLGASIAARFFFMAYFPTSLYGSLLPVCAEYFAWGCLFAWWDRKGSLSKLSPAMTFYISLLAVLSLIAIEYYRGDSGLVQSRTTHYQTPIALGIGFFIWALWALKPTHHVVRFLSWKPLVYFGGMSYTLYLVHLMAPEVFAATNIDLPFSPDIDMIVGSFVMTFVMGVAIWHFWEKPIYGLRRFFPVGKASRPRPAVGPTVQSVKTPSAP